MHRRIRPGDSRFLVLLITILTFSFFDPGGLSSVNHRRLPSLQFTGKRRKAEIAYGPDYNTHASWP